MGYKTHAKTGIDRLAFQDDHAGGLCGVGDRGDDEQQQQRRRPLVFVHLDIPTFSRVIMSVRIVMFVVYKKAFVRYVKSVLHDDRGRRRSKRLQTTSTRAKGKIMVDLEVRQALKIDHVCGHTEKVEQK